MGTILKYLLYVFIAVIIYLFFVGFYNGTFNKNSTVGEISTDITRQTEQMIKDGYDKTKNAVVDKTSPEKASEDGGFIDD